MYSRLVLNFYHSWRWLWTDLPALPLPPSLWDERDVPPHRVNVVLGMEPRVSHLLGQPSAHAYTLMANVSLLSESLSLVWGVHWDEIQRTTKKPGECCEHRFQLEQGLHSQQVVAESMRSDVFTITSSTILPSEVSSHKDSCFFFFISIIQFTVTSLSHTGNLCP